MFIYPFDFLVGSIHFIDGWAFSHMKQPWKKEDYSSEYDKIAIALKEKDMYIEESSGLAINYGDTEVGMNKRMMKSMIQKGVRILTALDAHVPQDVGRFIYEMGKLKILYRSRYAEDGR